MPSLQNVVYQLMNEAINGVLNALHCAALLTKGNNIISSATNSDRTRVNRRNCCSFHAEHRIISSFKHSRLKCILWG